MGMNTAAKEKWDFHLRGQVAFQKWQVSPLTTKIDSKLNSAPIKKWDSLQTWTKAITHITKGENVFRRTRCQIRLSCEITWSAAGAAFCLNMFISSRQNLSLSESTSRRVRQRGLWSWALFFCWPFSHLRLTLGFPLPVWDMLFCSVLQDVLLPDADHWLVGNVRVWLMSLCQIVPWCFLHKVHDPKGKVRRACIFSTSSP